MDARYRIREANPSDTAALLRIERRAFSDPWSETSFRDTLTSAWTFVLLAEGPRGVVGYFIGREVARTGEVLNLAVAPEFRRRGIASGLLEVGLGRFRRSKVDEVFLEVRESNLTAQALYIARGFRPVGQRAAYYRNPSEDALVLRLALERSA